MLVTCIVVSHAKPDFCHQALASLVAQSHRDWQGLVIDSGDLLGRGYFQQFSWSADERLSVLPSGESSQLRRRTAMAPWCINECFRRDLVRGELVLYLCDDDLLYPHAMETFVSYATRHPAALAMYASEDVGVLRADGSCEWIGERRAIGMAGRCCRGRVLDCRVDYLQFCHRLALLRRFPGRDGSREWWPECKLDEHHADGVFMERCGELAAVHPIDVKIGLNRRTPLSSYAPSSRCSI